MTMVVDRVRAVAFDLDGTLVDSVPDLAAAANATLAELGAAPLPAPDIAAMVGDGIDALVARALAAANVAAGHATLAAARTRFRAHYVATGHAHTAVYPGVREGLERLAARGLALAVVTNKAGAFTRPLLEAIGLARHFAATFCAERPEERKPAPDLLLAAAAQLGVAPGALLYVGDSAVDAAAARAAGCPFVAVAYGYGRVEDADAPKVARLTDIAALREAAAGVA